MTYIYPFFIAFCLVFISELGDKTQLLVLSFSNKAKPILILFGVAIGSFFSHGFAILFGSSIRLMENETLHMILQIITYLSFILFSIVSFLPKEEKCSNKTKKESFLNKLSNIKLNYIFIIAFSIIIGEFGDKTFLASLGLGINYNDFKLSLILGAILGMVASDSIALFLGKFLSKYIKESVIQKISGILFLVFGIVGLSKFIFLYLKLF